MKFVLQKDHLLRGRELSSFDIIEVDARGPAAGVEILLNGTGFSLTIDRLHQLTGNVVHLEGVL